MSTHARKTRKRLQSIARELGYTGPAAPYRYTHPVKVGTPIADRLENQPRAIYGKGPNAQPTRFGLTHGARRRLEAAGLVIDSDTVKQPGWFRRLFGRKAATA